jgi:hypothetical protein
MGMILQNLVQVKVVDVAMAHHILRPMLGRPFIWEPKRGNDS